MESFQQPFQQQTSFIPKKSLVLKPENHHSYGIFTPVAVVLFMVALISWGVTYAYELQLRGELASARKEIARQEEVFNPKLLADLQRLDSRISVTKKLLGKHITIIPFFEFLSTETIRGLRFSGLTYLSGKDATAQLSLSGEAKDYEAIALQSDVLGDDPRVKQFLFSNLALSKTGTVGFALEMSLDPALFLYSERLKVTQ